MIRLPILCLISLLAILSVPVYSQSLANYKYEPSLENPFGLPNPEAPDQVQDFAPLIGECTCKSVARNPDQTWADTVVMIWRFKYIMNGMAVQDETLKEDGVYAGSIRQYNADSAKWYVHYYSSNGIPSTLPSWEGTKTDEDKIILYRSSNAPDGTPGFYRITFYDMRNAGFNWLGEWVNLSETIQYPLWNIYCSKNQ